MSHKLSVLLERYREAVAQVLGKGFNIWEISEICDFVWLLCQR